MIDKGTYHELIKTNEQFKIWQQMLKKGIEMKVLLLAGGYGTRLSEETDIKPKPMIEIGGKPILWHIMKMYSHYGFNEFVILLGYKGYYIKEYLLIIIYIKATLLLICQMEIWRFTTTPVNLGK